jgi:hypothetical protein
MLKRAGVVVLSLIAFACSGSSNSPSSPSSTSSSSGTRIIGLSGSLAFGSVTIGQSGNANFTITNTGNLPLAVSGLTMPGGISSAFSASWTSGTIAAGASQQVGLNFAPTVAQSYSGTLTVTGDQTGGTSTIAVSATGVLPAGTTPTRIISVSGTLSFGSVAVGQSAQDTFTITNSGNSTLTITSITAPCSGSYSASFTSGTIPPGGSQQVTVTFKPTAAQSCSGTVTVVGDQTSGTNTLPVTATGTPSSTSPAPPSTSAGKYDGVYDFFFKFPSPSGQSSSNLRSFLIIRNSVVTASDGTISNGTVDSFGAIRFNSPCTINSSTATWVGNMNASALSGSNFGQGTYTCSLAIGNQSQDTWQATQSGR